MKTQTIAGYEITLLEGHRYFASRPIINRMQKVYPVTIRPLQTVLGQCLEDVTIDGLTYDQANDLINEFNNEACSFSGRIW